MKGVSVKTCAGYGLLIAVCALVSILVVHYGAIWYVWLTSEPGCQCLSQKLYKSRFAWEQNERLIEGAVVPLFVFSCWLFSRFFFEPRFLKSLVGAAFTGGVAWLVFQALIEPNMLIDRYFPVEITSVVGIENIRLTEMLIAPMFTWKFVVALAAFFLGFAGTWLAFRGKARREEVVTASLQAN